MPPLSLMFIYFWLGLGFLFPSKYKFGHSSNRPCLRFGISVSFSFYFYFLIFYCVSSRSCVLLTRLISFFFNKIFIKNRSYSTIHTFKNYFAITFSVFSKISGIQTHSKYIYFFDKFQFMNMKYH